MLWLRTLQGKYVVNVTKVFVDRFETLFFGTEKREGNRDKLSYCFHPMMVESFADELDEGYVGGSVDLDKEERFAKINFIKNMYQKFAKVHQQLPPPR
jgi:hypothetical protein